ncbi:MDR family MFS transporter [Streptomyces sp. NPDC056721]|uniref:MDR family MFS transporter n=1 Tax=Streptomyces sp. NPDC056721 TaxID=3345923 RepID=UPI003674926B
MEQLIVEDPARIGPYRLIARLGEGGMGRVYLARSDVGRTVAVKVVQDEYAQHPEFRKRFAREVDAARRVGGDWTAAVLDADTEAAVPWVATQYIPGPDLTTVVARDFGPLPEHSVETLANRLALALQAVHEAGLLHRDLKPSNVLVTVDGPRVIDFGIARALDSLVGDSLHTHTGMLIGSPGFMSPEQVRGLALTPASDVFCLGALLVYAATGRLLFGATGGLNAHLFRIAEEEADLSGVPESLAGLVGECLHKDPARRPTSQQVVARTTSDRDEEWLPGAVLAQLVRHAAQLLDYAPEIPEAPAAPAVPAPRSGQPPTPPPASSATTPVVPIAPVEFVPALPNSYAAVSAPASQPPAADQGLHPLRWWGLAAITLAQLLVLVNAAYLSLMAPFITRDLHLSAGQLLSVDLAYPLAFSSLLFLGGRVADLVGRKRALFISLGGFAVASALGGAASTSGVLITAFALQGVFAALLLPSVLALISAAFPEPKARGRAFGVFGAVAVGGAAIGTVVGPWLIEYASWRLCLYADVPIAAIAVVGAATVVRDRSGRTAARLDGLGAVLGTGGLLALSFAVNMVWQWGWSDLRIVAPFVAGVLLLAGFAFWQTKAGVPLLSPYVFQDRRRLGALLTMTLTGAALIALLRTQTVCLSEVRHYAQLKTGEALLPAFAAAVIGSTQISARLLHRVAPRTLVVPGLALVAVGVVLMTGMKPDGAYTAQVLPSLVLSGLGAGIALTPLFAHATDGIEVKDSGAASAAMTIAQHVSGSIGLAAFSGLVGSAIVSRYHAWAGAPKGLEEVLHSGHALRTIGQIPAAYGISPNMMKSIGDATVGGYVATLWWVLGLLVVAGATAWLMMPSRRPADTL